MFFKIDKYKTGCLSKLKLLESYQGWQAYAKWVNTNKLRKDLTDYLKDI